VPWVAILEFRVSGLSGLGLVIVNKCMILVLLLVFIGSVQGAITYVDADHGVAGNTVGAISGDHSDWQTTVNDNNDDLWATVTGHVDGVNGTWYNMKTRAASGREELMVKTTITGLAAGAYNVYVYHLSDNATGPYLAEIQAGLSETSLANFTVLDVDKEFFAPKTYRSLVGIGTADGSGVLDVYIDDNGVNAARTW
jgi:hypothetical protein